MPELRRDPLNNRWVIIAPERARRPQPFEEQPVEAEGIDPARDPFAVGNERYTTPEIYALRESGSEPDGPGWKLRVIPNKYPALRVEGDWSPPPEAGLFESISAIGAHEVVIETPDSHQFHELSVAEVAAVLEAFRLRMDDLYHDRRIVQVLPFKNHGRKAGATLPHSHSQLVALPFLPPLVETQLASCRSYWEEHRRSLFAEIVDQELEAGERVVVADEHFLAVCPYASALPYEVQIIPKTQSSDFRMATEGQQQALARTIKTVLGKWLAVLGPVAYNFMLFSTPSTASFLHVEDQFPALDSYYRWHVQMFPRLTRQGGYEWGTGCHINIVAPEEAAAALRCAKVEP